MVFSSTYFGFDFNVLVLRRISVLFYWGLRQNIKKYIFVSFIVHLEANINITKIFLNVTFINECKISVVFYEFGSNRKV